ncbi:MAG: phosphodiesterase YaeI [Puniceicoccales bacterium]|jgi:predicted MPP superfamily phosphohydrolase|nr:phosphodiesterase YaeI [Puniceicoccales bacterium]
MTNPGNRKNSAGRLLTRRRFLGLSLAGAGMAFGSGIYARFVESDWFEVRKVLLPKGKFPGAAGLRILHLSDLHWSGAVSLQMLERAFRMGLDLKPDLICLTGDFVTNGFPSEPSKYSKLMRILSDKAPTFACQGNHDVPVQPIKEMLEAGGVRFLQNETVFLSLQGRPVRITGLSDLWSGHLDPALCMDLLSEANNGPVPHILLCHNADGKENVRDYAWDIMLSGHTHGGQICLPFYGAIVLPVQDRGFVAGLYSWENRLIYITRGVGNLHGIRFWCRPEITLLVS